ncbi:hypothetical protein Tco_1418297, partial [Tanacetum coccineum]
YIHVIGFGIIRGYIYIYIIAWRPASLGCRLLSDLYPGALPNSPKAAPASPDYVPGPEEPEHAPLWPDYVSGPEYPEYLAPSDEEVPMEDQSYVVVDSPIAYHRATIADIRSPRRH